MFNMDFFISLKAKHTRTTQLSIGAAAHEVDLNLFANSPPLSVTLP